MSLPTDLAFYFIAIIAIIVVGLAKGGFSGLGAITMPLLALVMDPVKAAAMLLPVLIVQDIVGVWAFRKTWDRITVVTMASGAFFGVVLGWYFAASVSASLVGGMIGVIAVAFGAVRLMSKILRLSLGSPTLPDWIGLIWGVIAGFTSQVAHAGGPPFQIWATTRRLERDVFVGTSAIFFATVNWMKVPAYFALGQFTMDTMLMTLLFLPLAIASTFLGVWLVRRIDARRFFTLIDIIMILIGFELIRGVFS